jgi:hypothetical protein
VVERRLCRAKLQLEDRLRLVNGEYPVLNSVLLTINLPTLQTNLIPSIDTPMDTEQSSPPSVQDSNKSRTESLFKGIRNMPLFKQLIPMESGIGWPIPVRRDGKVYLKFLFFGQSSTGEKGKIALTPPFATLTLNWANAVPVEYIDLRFQNPAPDLIWEGQVGIFPHQAVERIPINTYIQKRQELFALYDDLFNALAKGDSRTADQDAEFAHLFSTLLESPLIPYYRAIAPKFIDRFLIQI